MRVVDTSLHWVYLFLRIRQHRIVISCLQVIFQQVDVERHEGNYPTPHLAVNQVITQGEIQQFPFPDGLLGNLRFGCIQVKGIVIGHTDGCCGILMLHPIVLQDPLITVLDSLGQRTDSSQPTTMNIHEIHKRPLVVYLLRSLSYRIIKGNSSRHGHAGGFHQHHIIDTIGHLFQQIRAVVAYLLMIEGLIKPGSYKGMTAHHDDDGEHADGFQTGGEEQGGIQTSAQLLCQHLVGQTNSLTARLEARRGLTIADGL